MGFFQRLFGNSAQDKQPLEAFKAEAKLDVGMEASAESTAEFLAHLQTQQKTEDSDPVATLLMDDSA